MTTPEEQAGTLIPDRPLDCAECAADDGGWAELEAELRLSAGGVNVERPQRSEDERR